MTSITTKACALIVLGAYEAREIGELSPAKISDFLRIKYGGTNTAKQTLGSVQTIQSAFLDIQKHLYRGAA